MQWTTDDPHYGDIIRVKQMFFYHYGIFVSEENVIQFGYKDNSGIDPDEICVVSTDIYAFSEGEIIETQKLSHKELKTRKSPEETVQAAVSRLGEKGYNILNNNCEHFVNECAFGEKRSFLDAVRSDVRKKLKNTK
ncbi:MAG: lecithin retinol acyltransferase family protein [Clostridia bacterium]|nr:lecithin retinol acyltransferase family protein [Clostridia bacterium]